MIKYRRPGIAAECGIEFADTTAGWHPASELNTQ
jgi:hypothetical protein